MWMCWGWLGACVSLSPVPGAVSLWGWSALPHTVCATATKSSVNIHPGDDGGQAGVNFLTVTHHSWPKHKGRVFGLPNQFIKYPHWLTELPWGETAMMAPVSIALQELLGIPCSGATSFLWATHSRVLRVFFNLCYKNIAQIYTVVTQIL